MTNMLETQLVFVQSLYEIICESDEPETIRRALAALTSTQAGRDYIKLHPFTI